MKEISLTQGKVSLVDDVDYEWLSQWKWSAHRGLYGHFEAIRKGSDGLVLLMHRVILGLKRGDGILTDHKNGNSLDNQRRNLRTCTRKTNPINRKMNANSTSGYRGVTWHGRVGKWQAQIQVSKQKIHLGYFGDPLDAAIAYKLAAIKYHGEFARTA